MLVFTELLHCTLLLVQVLAATVRWRGNKKKVKFSHSQSPKTTEPQKKAVQAVELLNSSLLWYYTRMTARYTEIL